MIMSPWTSDVDYSSIEAGVYRAMDILGYTTNTAIICDSGIEPSVVFNMVKKNYPAHLYTGGVQKYMYYGKPSYSDLPSDVYSQERDGALTWLQQGGIIVTHTRLFVGMESDNIIWVTRLMGGRVVARSNVMRAVSRLVIVTNSDTVKTDAVKKYFTLETIGNVDINNK